MKVHELINSHGQSAPSVEITSGILKNSFKKYANKKFKNITYTCVEGKCVGVEIGKQIVCMAALSVVMVVTINQHSRVKKYLQYFVTANAMQTQKIYYYTKMYPYSYR